MPPSATTEGNTPNRAIFTHQSEFGKEAVPPARAREGRAPARPRAEGTDLSPVPGRQGFAGIPPRGDVGRQATRLRASQPTTFFGMHGRPGLRTYFSPFAGMQSGSSRSASAASQGRLLLERARVAPEERPERARDVSDGVAVPVCLVPERPGPFPKGDMPCDCGAERWRRECATAVRNVGGGHVRLRCGTERKQGGV